MSEFKNNFLNKDRHRNFLNHYWENQMEHIIRFSLIVGIFGVLGFIFAVPVEHAAYPILGYIKYGTSALGDFGFALFAGWLIKTPRYNNEKKAGISEAFTFVFGMINMLWGVFNMEASYYESGTRNPIIILIIMAIITSILYYPLQHYLAIIITSVILVVISFSVHPADSIDATSILCSAFMMVLLFNLGITRYVYGRDRFEVEKSNEELLKQTEAQNEELIAGNEELTALNEELSSTTDKLSQALDELEKSSQAQKMFTNSMNHELRAPLNGIIGNLQVMLMDKQLDDDMKVELNECMSMSRSMLGIVNELLDFAKMDAGELRIIPEAFDLHSVINNLTGMFKNIANQKGLVYITDIPYDMPCGLYADDSRIQQILTNLVSNAVKYTNEGYVKLSAFCKGDVLTFKVSDSGQGMSEESIKELFTPFKRFEEGKNRKIQGTGLGMSIVKQLADLMGGTIEVDSVLKKGSVFTISIPVKIIDPSNIWQNGTVSSSAAAVKSDPGETQDTDDLTGLKILYVDDSGVNLKIITKFLAGTGADITCCQDPREGLENAVNNKFDIMFFDHQMPLMDGPELLAEVRKHSDKNASTPVVIFTGNAGAGVESEYYKMGFSGYLLKPVIREDLLKLISKIK